MVTKRGQGALEYLAVYGWAVMILAVVAIVMWQMGIFGLGGSPTGAAIGFSSVRPIESSCRQDPGGDILSVAIVNGQGRTIRNVTMTIESSTVNCAENIPVGGLAVCNLTNVNCGGGKKGDRFEVDVQIGYESIGGLKRKSSGTVQGTIE